MVSGETVDDGKCYEHGATGDSALSNLNADCKALTDSATIGKHSSEGLTTSTKTFLPFQSFKSKQTISSLPRR